MLFLIIEFEAVVRTDSDTRGDRRTRSDRDANGRGNGNRGGHRLDGVLLRGARDGASVVAGELGLDLGESRQRRQRGQRGQRRFGLRLSHRGREGGELSDRLRSEQLAEDRLPNIEGGGRLDGHGG